MNLQNKKIAIIGLGYVGLPLAIEFGKQRPVLGFDINAARIQELQSGQDHTLEASPAELAQAAHLSFSSNPADLAACQIYIVTVPTPVDQANRPDLTPLVKASETVGKVLKAGDIVIYESTVYPGATEEVCVPVLEKFSGLKYITSPSLRGAEGDAAIHDPVNQIYNIALGDRTTLNTLYAQIKTNLLPLYPHLQAAQPIYRDFRPGDVRHSLADISKAQRLLGYAPTQRIGQGLALAMPWYLRQKPVATQ